MNSIHDEIKQKTKYKISNIQLKMVMLYLGWVKNGAFNIDKPKNDDINPDFSEYIWIETIDNLKGKKKVVFSPKAVTPLLEIVEDSPRHVDVFGALLKTKS